MALTPTGTRELLARLGHSPKRFLGQNFLVDGNIVRKSLELAQIGPGDAVAEVGPGLGTLTEALLEAGAEVWAVELDRTLHAHLEEGLVTRHPGRLHLVEGDAVELPLANMPQERIAAAKVVANLPYAISTPWMDSVLSGVLPSRLVLMLQKEAADRYGAAPDGGNFGAISIFLQAAYDIAPGHKVSPACFHPRPDVDSALMHLVRKPEPFIFSAEDKAVVRRCFQQRRKQIGAIIRDQIPDREQLWRELLQADGFSSTVRAETIPVATWIRLVSANRRSA
ncbi:MAG TPA: 16S rRNA (adenine(1518)-N(6)/adenine(1519)-N(6))-dimethyltransferase RsmA [Opitutaceae bacterium]|jgi:16S rRNA (adenine1518-N6/adenine1519-N6)-dimethyltransferase|nr:16S rRNA (adenine(1518)-N(6)/adenine(1519)-N(6))-dimethyltransferase RsmA [Opitutaceae bacterium]